MSRGLGQLQRAILATLDEAKRKVTPYTGCNDGERVRYHGREFHLPADTFDLRASLQYLARATGQIQTGLTLRRSVIAKPAFSSAFSRAVRSLVTAGYLELADRPVSRGPFRDPWPNRRLVRRTEKHFSVVSTDMYNAYIKIYDKYRQDRRERDERMFRLLKAALDAKLAPKAE